MRGYEIARRLCPTIKFPQLYKASFDGGRRHDTTQVWKKLVQCDLLSPHNNYRIVMSQQQRFNKSVHCREEGCDKVATFGLPSVRVAVCCLEHKTLEMINVKGRCIHKDCTKTASFGVRRGHPDFCKGHAEQGMICLTTKKCEHPDCDKQPSFNHVTVADFGNIPRPRFCKIHQEDGMVNVITLVRKMNKRKRELEGSAP